MLYYLRLFLSGSDRLGHCLQVATLVCLVLLLVARLPGKALTLCLLSGIVSVSTHIHVFAGFNSLSACFAGELWSGCQTRGAATRILPTLLPGSVLIYSCSLLAVVDVVCIGFLCGKSIRSRPSIC